ncbi:UNVERIFIED_CONTAM: hypothetical protein FKN15_075108 [Acipenser sinensis]
MISKSKSTAQYKHGELHMYVVSVEVDDLNGGIVKPELSRGLSGPPNLLTSQEEEQVEGMEKGVAGSSVPSSTMERLRLLRQNVANLLTSVLPHLDLKEISFDTGDIDHILEKVIEANKI